MPVPFPIPQDNACTNGVSCPVTSGTTYSETLSLTVLEQYPSVFIFLRNF